MIQSARGPGLLLESSQPLGMPGEGGWHHLDGYIASDARVSRAIDFPHAASAQKGHNLVVPDHASDHGSGSAFGKGFGRHLERWRFQEALCRPFTSEQ